MTTSSRLESHNLAGGYSAIPFAVTAAGLPLMTADDIQAGRALSVDFTGEGWAARHEFPPVPIYSPTEAGAKLAQLAAQYLSLIHI